MSQIVKEALLDLKQTSLSLKHLKKDIRKFLDLFESLPTTLLIRLKSCEEKVFDIGFESGTGQVHLDNLIDAEIITRVSQLSFSLGIRIYPVRPSKPKNNVVTKDNHKI